MSGNPSAEQLRLIVERIERLEEDKKGVADDIREVYAEAKGTGFDTPTIREIIKLRAKEKDARLESEALLETYKSALGLGDGAALTPQRDPNADRIQAAIVAALRALGRATMVALKTAVKDKAAKALSYAELTVHLGELIEAGEVESGPSRIADFPEYWVAA